MTRSPVSKAKTAFVALLCGLAAVSVGGAANACSLVRFGDNGQYVGGDLPTQIAAKADTVQIVRVVGKYLVRRTYSEGEWYLSFGNTEVPEGYPEFIDEFVFALEPVETLRRGADPTDFAYERDLRIRGFGPVAAERLPPAHPNALPGWLSESPGRDGYVFIGASEHAGLGGGECAGPYMLEVGQTLLAFRDSIGRLYPSSGAFPLKIDVSFLTNQRQREEFAINMQSLIPISGSDDPFVASIREALANRPAGSNED